MAKFSGQAARTRYGVTATSPVRSASPVADTRTFEGGYGWSRDAKSELFLLAVTNMVGEDTFYEGASDRDVRFRLLVQQVTAEDPGWIARFVPFLRSEMNMRSASVVMAAEYALATRGTGAPADAPSVRTVINAALQRADEPAEFVAYWRHRTNGDGMPAGVQRGVEDALVRLYTERAALKYDGASRGLRMADVIALARPKPTGDEQRALWTYLADRRHGRADSRADFVKLPVISQRLALEAFNADARRATLERWVEQGVAGHRLAKAGMTWEALSGWLQGPMDRLAWEAIIPSMGYMALLRNLRNFDQAGVGDDVAATVAAKLANPDEVVRSRQLPMRFLSAYRHAPSLRWSYPLEQALTQSLRNIPVLDGETLVLVDTSTSMHAPFSKDGSLMRWDAAAVFGLALALRCASAQVVSFSSTARYWGDPDGANTKVFDLRRAESLLRAVGRWDSDGFFLGGGTDTAGAVRKHYTSHDRVVILTDEQAESTEDVTAAIPSHIPVYTWNLAGYRAGHAASGSGNRHVFGGLTDAAFRMIPLLEVQKSQAWPF